MARSGHGLLKVSPMPTMPYPSTPCGRATPETPVLGVTCLQGRWPATIFYPFGHPMLYAYVSGWSGIGWSLVGLRLRWQQLGSVGVAEFFHPCISYDVGAGLQIRLRRMKQCGSCW
jgi:hypothetical protein